MNVVTDFENEIKKCYNTPLKDVIAVNSGTSALIACLWSLDMHECDEVITTPFTYQATLNAILISKATPVFADIEAKSKIMSLISLEHNLTINTKAVLPVYLYGKIPHALWKQKLKQLDREDIIIIEDACQAFLARDPIFGEYAGVESDAACFSFYKTKNLSTFEGGAIVIPWNSKLDAKKIRAITNQGQTSKGIHQYVGFNFRMPEPCALIGLNMLQTKKQSIVDGLKYQKNENYGYYSKLVYDQPSAKEFKQICPIAQQVAKDIKQNFERHPI